MSTRALATALLVAAVAAPFGTPGTAQAQGGALTAAFAVGGRVRVDSLDPHSKGKFEEYQHVPENAPFLQQLRLDYLPPGRNVIGRFVLREPGERDQGTWVRASAPGQWDLQARWDRITHTFSSDARSLGTVDPQNGVFTLPTPRPDTATWNRFCPSASTCDPYLDASRVRWDPVRAVFGLTSSEKWSSKADFTWISKKGDRPMGMSFGSPGNNFREILEPIDQTVTDLRLTQGYMRRRVQAVVTYEFSRFSNSFTSVTADNPLVTTSTVAGGPAQGRSALAPTNLAHMVTGTGSVSFPKSTRITGTVSLGWRKQNQAFIPPTINSAIVVPNLDQFPKSLDGSVRTTLLNLSASSRPMRHLNLAGRFRYFDQSDHTPELVMPAEVVSDRSLNAVAEARDGLPFSKTNAEVSATWRLDVPVSVTGAWTFERWERARLIRNARHTNEHAARIAMVANPLDWMELRASFNKGWRRVVGDYLALTEDQPDGFRRFDQSDRDRDKWEVQTQLNPNDKVSFGGIFITGRSTYTDAVFGLQKEKNFLAGGDLAWTPVPRLNLGVDYTRETFKSQQRSRYREPTQIANPTYDWVSNNDDYIDTFGASVNGTLVPGRLEVGGNIEYAKSRLVNAAFNPTTPTGGTATQNANAVAGNWPDITQKSVPGSAWARYWVSKEWAATAQFWYDKFDKTDFRTDGLMPATGADIFLGNDYRNYRATFLTITISYRPQLLRPGGRSAL